MQGRGGIGESQIHPSVSKWVDEAERVTVIDRRADVLWV